MMNANNKVKTTRRTEAEGAVNLAKWRTWYAEPTAQEALQAIQEASKERRERDAHRKQLVGDDPIQPRTYNGIPTFALLLEHRHHDYDVAAVETVSNYADREYARAEKIAADERLTPQAKDTDIQAILSDAREEANERYWGQLETVQRQLDEAARKAVRSLAPKAEDAATLNYVTNALMTRASTHQMKEPELFAIVEQGLAAGDLITARVFYDTGVEMHRLMHGSKPGEQLFLGKRFEELRQRCDAALLTSEQKKARADVKRLEATRLRLHEAKSAVERRFKNVQITNNNGKASLVDGAEMARREMFRSRF